MRLSEKVHIKEKLIRRFPILKDEITCIFLMKYHNVLVILFSIDSFLFLKVYDLKVQKMSSKESAAWATPRVLTIVNTYFLKAIFFYY